MTGAPYTTKRDRFRSSLSGREYPWAQDFSGTSRAAALAQLQSEDKKIIDAANDRALRQLGRPLTTHELVRGDWAPESRDLRTRIAEDGKLTSQPKLDADANPHELRLQELRTRNFRTKDEKAQIARRIEAAQRD